MNSRSVNYGSLDSGRVKLGGTAMRRGFHAFWTVVAVAPIMLASLAAMAQLPARDAGKSQPGAPVATPSRPTVPAGSGPSTAGSGQQVPRFASLKSDRVNMRTGPGTDYPMQWVYRRAGLPVEVMREFESWRQIRDAEGATGWVLGALISNRRTALVEPWSVRPDQPAQTRIMLKRDGREGAGDVAVIEAGVIANINICDGRWCSVTIGDFRGYLQQQQLWGVYKGESVR